MKLFFVKLRSSLVMGVLLLASMSAHAQTNVVFLTDLPEFDQQAIDFISSVAAGGANITVLTPAEVTTPTMEAADLVVIGRGANSGGFNDSAERAKYNTLTVPVINMSAFITRSSRLRWFDSTSIPGDEVFTSLRVVAPADPIFDGVTILTSGTTEVVKFYTDGPYTPAVDHSGTTNTTAFLLRGIVTDLTSNTGTLLATHDTVTTPSQTPLLITWDTGQEFYLGSGEFAGGPRCYFQVMDDNNRTSGTTTPYPFILDNMTADGRRLFRNVLESYASSLPVELSTFELE